jgi:hypothetical protein
MPKKKMQRYYHNIDSDYYGKIRMLTGFFVSCLKRMFNSILEDLKKIHFKIFYNLKKDKKRFLFI